MNTVLAQLSSEVEDRCQSNGIVSLFLDFDGTLTPIAQDPATPRLDAKTSDVLRKIAMKPAFVTTIISGRAVEDLYSRVRVEGLIYAGNHGIEIFGRNLCFVEPVAAALREELAQLSEELTVKLGPISGILVEYKGATSSVHYRRVAEQEVALVQDVVRNALENHPAFRLGGGRKVLEIVPRTEWHKGTAALWINRHLGRQDVVSIYIGDDVTDEDAFRSLPDAITVKVGGCRIATRARYRVEGPEEVYQFLDWLSDFLLSPEVEDAFQKGA
jgi:trehalose-phosphatase